MTLQWLFFVIFFSVTGAYALSDKTNGYSIPTNTDEVVGEFLNRSDFPAIPSENADKSIKDAIRDPALNALLDRFNRDVFRGSLHFEVLSGSFGNILTDTQRKLILFDPKFLEALIRAANANKDDAELLTTAVLAHELAHYVLALMEFDFPGRSFKLDLKISDEHMEHALVEALACELMQESGFSRDEIQKAMGLVHQASDTAFGILSDLSVDDRKMRRLAVENWLPNESLKIQNLP